MSRKKTVKRTAKRQAPQAAPSSIQKIEKDFLEAPAKLALQLNKEVSALQQKEVKAKKALSKIDVQVKRDAARVKAASKTKNTAAGKKQFVIAQKAHAESAKSQSAFAKQIQEIISAISAASSKQAKFLALGKQLSQFEKEWAQKAKKAASKAKATRKKKAKAKSALKAVASSNVESISQAADASNNQITELAS